MSEPVEAPSRVPSKGGSHLDPGVQSASQVSVEPDIKEEADNTAEPIVKKREDEPGVLGQARPDVAKAHAARAEKAPAGVQVPVFRKNYRRSNCCSRILYSHGNPLIDAVIANDYKMKEDMIEDMTRQDGETERNTKQLMEGYERNLKKLNAKKEHEDNHYYAFRNSLFSTFRGDVAVIALSYMMAEMLAVGFTSFIVYVIRYLKDPDAPLRDGIIYIVIFAVMMLSSSLFRNYFFFTAYVWSINMRKAIFASLLQKATRLSMKSMTETNSGKLVTIVNADIQQMERSLSFVPLILVAPLVNVLAYVIIGLQCGWLYSGITFAIWIVIVICQHFTAKQGGILKAKESASNDARQKLVQDMINGARTIKCYGWEEHYIENIK